MDDIRAYLSKIGAQGGKASLTKMTAAQRRSRALKAVQQREANRKANRITASPPISKPCE